MRSNEIELLVNWGDTDKAGIIYYPNYFKWFDIAGHQFFRSCNLAPQRLEDERNIILPLIDVRCTFEIPLLYDDIITIQTAVEEINNKTIKLFHQVFKGDLRSGYGYELRGWVYQSSDGMKAVKIPEDVREILSNNVHTTEIGKRSRFNA
jgi:acyl-CoA thioester hydrolase